MYQLYRDRPILVLCMVLANIILSAWCLNIDPVINNDGVIYLSLAEMMLDGKWNAAFDYYSWPFYSVFIAATAKLLFIDVESAAYLLNTIFATSLTLAFVCIVAELSNNNRRIIVIAMLVILFFPSITKYRSFIIRDFGYLSCYLWSLYFIFRFCSTLDRRHLIGWLAFASLSCLFRFEGIAFLLIAPYFLILFTAKRLANRHAIIGALSIFLVLASAFLSYWYINDKYSGLIEVAQASGKDINNIVDLFLDNTRERLGGEELTTWNYFTVLLKNVGDVTYELVRRMAVFYFLFALFAYYKNIGFTSALTKRVWIVFVLTNISMLMVYSLYNNFLASRYTMASALTLLILSPFVINQLIEAFANYRWFKRVGAALAISLLTIVSIEGLDVRTKKNHIKEAGLWIKNELPKDARIYSNDPLIIYYADRSAVYNLDDHYSTLQLWQYITSGHTHNFDYIAVSDILGDSYRNISRERLSYIYNGQHKIIDGPKDRKIFIFKVHPD